MCGIVGLMSTSGAGHYKEKLEFFRQALQLDTIRGDDSTGIFAVERDKVRGKSPPYAYWSKAVMDGYDFTRSSYWDKALGGDSIQDYKFVVGHNRAATRGGVSVQTAHPFTEGPITLVHNGTLVTTATMAKSQHELGAHNDSHTICHNLAITEDAASVISAIDGAFTLVWHDARDDSLNFVRNSQRPMHMMVSRNHKTVYFGSEGEMLKWITRRMNIDTGPIASLQVGAWLKFFEKDIFNPEFKKVELYVPKGRVYTGGNHGYPTYTHTQTSTSSTQKSTDSGKAPAVLPPLELKVKIGGRMRPIPEYHQLELMDVNVDAERYYNFVAIRSHTTMWSPRDTTHWVEGYLADSDGSNPGLKARIPAAETRWWSYQSDRVWCVQVVGVDNSELDDPTVLCKVVQGTNTEGVLKFVIGRRSSYASENGKRTITSLPGKPVIAKDDKEASAFIDGDCACTKEKECPKHKPPEAEEVVVRGPGNAEFSWKQIKMYIAGGCSGCGDPITYTDIDDIEWEGDKPFCEACWKSGAGCDDIPWNYLH